MAALTFLHELRRRNVLRAGVLYIGAVWALAQGAAQLLPVFGVSNSVTRWIVIAGVVGFPFWLMFAWFYEFTPEGIKREAGIAPADSIARATGRKLDLWIIAVLSLAVVLLLTNQFAAHREAGERAAIPDSSIAVLPLVNESGDKEQQYFSDGLSEDLITALSQFDGLKVIGRNSAFMFRNTTDDSRTIGAKLGVAHLLEGSVRRAGDSVRISAELINAHDGSTLWSERYDRPYRDLFKLQDDITQAVASALKTKLLSGGAATMQSDRPPSGNLEAYAAYQRGKFHHEGGSEAGDKIAIDAFTEAIRIDPVYALAHAELANTLTTRAAQFLAGADAQQAYARAHMEAATALSLDPNLAAAHVARGHLLLYADYDWTGAEAEFRRSLQLAPNDSAAKFYLASLWAALGMPERAATLNRQAQATDPLNARAQLWLARYLCAVGKLDEAGRTLDKAIELQPDGAAYREQQTIIWVLKGDATRALQAAEREPSTGGWKGMAVALAQQIGGDPAAADAALHALIDAEADSAAYQIAEVYALRNDPDAMFAWLDRAWNNRDPAIQTLLYDPLVLRFASDARFAAFCRKTGLPLPAQKSAGLVPAMQHAPFDAAGGRRAQRDSAHQATAAVLRTGTTVIARQAHV